MTPVTAAVYPSGPTRVTVSFLTSVTNTVPASFAPAGATAAVNGSDVTDTVRTTRSPTAAWLAVVEWVAGVLLGPAPPCPDVDGRPEARPAVLLDEQAAVSVAHAAKIRAVRCRTCI